MSRSASQQERRQRASQQKDAIFFDSGERKRMWRLVASLWIAIFGEGLVILVLLVLLAIAVAAAISKDVYGIVEHEDGRLTTFLGVLTPLHGDATETLMQQNAIRYVTDLATVTATDELVTLKASVLSRTAAGSPAVATVTQVFDAHFRDAARGHKQPRNVDCRPDGTFAGPDKPMRFDCYFLLVNADGADAADPQKAPSQNMIVRLELTQSRGKSPASLLITNPDEIFATYVSGPEAQ